MPFEPLITLFLLSFLAATFVPIGSEAYFIFLLSESEPIFPLVLVATIGNSMGSVFTFYIGSFGKLSWAQRFLGISPQKVTSWKTKIQRRGWLLSFWCWVPILGDPLALALGYFKVPLKAFLPLMVLGKLVRFGFLSFLWLWGST